MNNFFEARTFCQWAFRIEFYFSSIPRERATELSPYLFEVIIDNGMAMDSGDLHFTMQVRERGREITSHDDDVFVCTTQSFALCCRWWDDEFERRITTRKN